MVEAGVWLVHLLGLEVGLLWLGVGLEIGLLGLGVGQEVGLLRSWFGCGWCRARTWVDGEVP